MTWRGLGHWVGVEIEAKDEDEKMAKEYKRWKIGNIGYIVQPQQLKWQQIGNTIGNKRQQPEPGLPLGRREVFVALTLP